MKSPSGVPAAVTLLALSLASSALHPQTRSAADDIAVAVAPANTVSVSEIRIVRLSEIRGGAELDRNTGQGFEPAFTNLPIVQNARLRTTAGVAEVEFEDNSSLRLTPGTLVDFPRLGRTSSGATLSTIRVLKGTVYISLTSTKSKAAPNQFAVTFGKPSELQTLALAPSTHIELSVDAPTTKLAVFEGAVDVQHGDTTVTVAKKKELLFNPSDPSAPTLITRIEKGPFDDWDKDQADYHRNYANAAFGLNSSYGISDLNYYGSFSSLPGCGNAWRPYFASASFDPFANGTWAYYPGAGYSWVSPYPWGWTPFHSGSWQQCGAAGWGWQPGGQWVGLQNIAQGSGSGSGLTPTHPKPPSAPLAGRPTFVVVSSQPLSVSRLAAPNTFVFSKDSAGLGVPRQTFGKLSSVSNDVARHGATTTSVVSISGVGSHGMSPASSGSAISGVTSVRPAGFSANSAAAYAQSNNAYSGFAHSPTSNSGASSNSSHASAATTTSAPTSSAPAAAPSGGSSSHH